MGTRIRKSMLKEAIILLVTLLARKGDCLTLGERINSRRTKIPGEEQYLSPRSRQPRNAFTVNMKSKMIEIDREIVRLGRRGKTDEALDLYYSISQPSLRVLNSAIDACSRARPARIEKAFELFSEGISCKNLKPNVFTFGSLMSACARARKADRAINLLRSMEKEYGVCPNGVVYSSAISACSRAAIDDSSKYRIALNLLEEVEEKGLEMSVVGFNAALGACSNAVQFEAAMALFEKMKLRGIVDQVSYGTVMAACEKGGQWDQVLKYARLMSNESFGMDGISVTSALHACQQKGLAEDALHYLNIMKQSPVHSQERKTAGWEREGARGALKGPDNVAYRLAISACARGGDWENGIALLDEMKESRGSADVIAYTAAITGCEYAGEWQRAFSLLERMRKDKVDPNEVTMASVINACATACSKGYNPSLAWKKAIQLLMVMKKDATVVNPNINVYNAAIRASAEARKVDTAFRLLEDAEENYLEPNIVTFGTLMTACERTESVEGMRRVFELMDLRDISPNEIIYGAAISCLRKASLSDQTLFLLQKMIQCKLKPNVATFNTVLISQIEGQHGSLEKALQTYKLMKASDHVKPSRQTYDILIKACCYNKQPKGAEAFIHLMRRYGFKPDVDLYTMTVTAYEKAGHPLRALRLMECMEEDGYDYYSIAPLNAAFKNAVKLVNAVGKSFTDEEDIEQDSWNNSIN